MRNYFLVLIIMALIFSCTEDNTIFSDGEELSTNVLTGKWQVVESFYSIGTGEQLSNPVENGSIIHLKNDGKFETNLIKGATFGSYQINGDSLIMNLNGTIDPSEYIYSFSINEGSLHISPLSPYICIEGCSQRLEKIE